MSEESPDALIRYRLGQARNAFAAAEILQENGLSRQAVGRAYYAVFYATLALLVSKQLGTSKHSGAIALFDREFVRPGLIGREYSKILHELFELRQRADYRELFAVSDNRARAAIANAGRFVNEAESYLRRDDSDREGNA